MVPLHSAYEGLVHEGASYCTQEIELDTGVGCTTMD